MNNFVDSDPNTEIHTRYYEGGKIVEDTYIHNLKNKDGQVYTGVTSKIIEPGRKTVPKQQPKIMKALDIDIDVDTSQMNFLQKNDYNARIKPFIETLKNYERGSTKGY